MALALLLLVLPAPAAAQARPSVVAVGFTVSDLDRETALLTEVLGFRKTAETELWGDAYEHLTGVFGARARVARLQLGAETVELTEFLTPRGRPIPIDSRSHDRWFQHLAIVVSDMDAAYARLREHELRSVSTGPQTLPAWNSEAGGIRAFYFQDQDGHNLEIIWYPPGKGDPRWQSKERLFLGIDHTAIVVADTAASLRFYRDALGLRVAGASENYGSEQEHLNLVFGARLRITALRGEGGPGIEFLEYLTPGGGRDMPPDSAAVDLAHWHVTLGAAALAPLGQALGRARAPLVSSELELPGAPLGYHRALRARDPDGHVVELTQP
jgi:catechol 2,3-dioxygenase-like lactoylglutathione lyase family enzyme